MQHTQTIQQMYEAFGRGDIATILASLSQDVLWGTNVDNSIPAAKHVPCFAPGSGHEFVAGFFKRFGESYEVYRFDVCAIMQAGNEAVARIALDMSVRSTGRRVRGEALHHYTFNDAGKVARLWVFEDTLAFATAWAPKA